MHKHVHVDWWTHIMECCIILSLRKLLNYFELDSDKMNSELKISADTIKDEELKA